MYVTINTINVAPSPQRAQEVQSCTDALKIMKSKLPLTTEKSTNDIHTHFYTYIVSYKIMERLCGPDVGDSVKMRNHMQKVSAIMKGQRVLPTYIPSVLLQGYKKALTRV